MRSWTVLAAKLATRFHVYSYSKRFAWPNEPIKDGEPQPWEQDSLDLDSFIETLKIGPVHLLGNSSGATNALWLSRTRPHLFRTLILEEPPLITLYMPTLPPDLVTLLSCLVWHPIAAYYVLQYGATTIGPAQAHAIRGEDDLAVTTFGRGCLGPKFWPGLLADPERKKQFDDNSKWLAHFLRYGVLPKYLLEDARKLTVPTLVLTGTDGPYFAQCIDGEFVQACGATKKREVKIQGAGHLVHENNPEQVFEEVVKFVWE